MAMLMTIMTAIMKMTMVSMMKMKMPDDVNGYDNE